MQKSNGASLNAFSADAEKRGQNTITIGIL
jgi:hypothetical protein